MPGATILVVDDNVMNLKLARLLLTSEGYVVSTANDAEEALQLLEKITPQMILLDLQLPGMDGLELTRRLRSDPRRRDLILVALTASAMKGDEEKAFAAGCDGYITKPIDLETLPEVIARYLARPRALRE